MTIRRFLRTGPATLAVASLLTLAACSGSGDTDTTPDSTGGADGIHTTDPMGHAVDLDHEPTAALGFYTTDVDILATLGFPLASSQPVRDDYDRLPGYFPATARDGVSYFHNYPEFNYEAVAEAAPDFVLNGLGYDDTSHDRLSAIAPTYTTNAFDGESWLSHFERTATDDPNFTYDMELASSPPSQPGIPTLTGETFLVHRRLPVLGEAEGLPRTGLTPSPQAYTASPAALIFVAAFTSRS